MRASERVSATCWIGSNFLFPMPNIFSCWIFIYMVKIQPIMTLMDNKLLERTYVKQDLYGWLPNKINEEINFVIFYHSLWYRSHRSARHLLQHMNCLLRGIPHHLKDIYYHFSGLRFEIRNQIFKIKKISKFENKFYPMPNQLSACIWIVGEISSAGSSSISSSSSSSRSSHSLIFWKFRMYLFLTYIAYLNLITRNWYWNVYKNLHF